MVVAVFWISYTKTMAKKKKSFMQCNAYILIFNLEMASKEYFSLLAVK